MLLTVRYFALHPAGLRNGSFYRVRGNGRIVAQFVNGDFMGNVAGQDKHWNGTLKNGLPETYCGKPLQEFPAEEAENLIPGCCL